MPLSTRPETASPEAVADWPLKTLETGIRSEASRARAGTSRESVVLAREDCRGRREEEERVSKSPLNRRQQSSAERRAPRQGSERGQRANKLTQLLHQSPALVPIQLQLPPHDQVFSRHGSNGDERDLCRLEARLREEGL
jgi:hypothetical protein